MRLFILGANGRTGSELIDLALPRGHRVTAFVRSPEKITRKDAGLTVVKGDPHDPLAMARSMVGHDAVFSALGPTPGEAFRGTTLLQDCAAATAVAMKEAGLKKIYLVSSAGLFQQMPFILRLFPLLFRHHIHDLEMAEAKLQANGLDWTIVRATRLVRTREENYQSAENAFPSGSWKMSFRAVASFMLESAEKGLHSRKIIGLVG